MELKTLKGLALHDILTEVHLFVHRGNWWSGVEWGGGIALGWLPGYDRSSSQLLLKLCPNPS